MSSDQTREVSSRQTTITPLRRDEIERLADSSLDDASFVPMRMIELRRLVAVVRAADAVVDGSWVEPDVCPLRTALEALR